MDTLANRLKTARKALGWTQGRLAKAAGVTQPAVGNIESGARDGKESIAALSEALGVRRKWLSDGEEPMYPPSQRWPFTPELLLAAMNADPNTVWQAENAARSKLKLAEIPRPFPLNEKQSLAA